MLPLRRVGVQLVQIQMLIGFCQRHLNLVASSLAAAGPVTKESRLKAGLAKLRLEQAEERFKQEEELRKEAELQETKEIDESFRKVKSVRRDVDAKLKFLKKSATDIQKSCNKIIEPATNKYVGHTPATY